MAAVFLFYSTQQINAFCSTADICFLRIRSKNNNLNSTRLTSQFCFLPYLLVYGSSKYRYELDVLVGRGFLSKLHHKSGEPFYGARSQWALSETWPASKSIIHRISVHVARTIVKPHINLSRRFQKTYINTGVHYYYTRLAVRLISCPKKRLSEPEAYLKLCV